MRLDSSPPVYVVIPTASIGGAEKRFAGLWLHLKRSGHSELKLVLPSALRERIFAIGEFAEAKAYREDIEVFDALGGTRALALRLRSLHARAPCSVFHYVMVSPAIAQWFRSPRTLFSITYSTLQQLNRKGRSLLYAGAIRAARSDVLDPGVKDLLSRRFFFKRNAFSLTPNSFVDLTTYAPVPFAAKENLLAFVGLFTEEKQAFRLVECLPAIDRNLKAQGIAAPRFVMLGRDIHQPGVVDACAKLRPQVDVRAYEENNPNQVLSRSKVFFSLQRADNYPSKSLLEALASGNVPVVTDVGQSRMIAREDFSFYVPRDFSAQDLAQHCLHILSMPEHEFSARVERARAFLAERFSIDAMARYYLRLYADLAAG
jgi:glycosyltransferase involved in cell wall biosynthesis